MHVAVVFVCLVVCHVTLPIVDIVVLCVIRPASMFL